jgi:hypothetical protein
MLILILILILKELYGTGKSYWYRNSMDTNCFITMPCHWQRFMYRKTYKQCFGSGFTNQDPGTFMNPDLDPGCCYSGPGSRLRIFMTKKKFFNKNRIQLCLFKPLRRTFRFQPNGKLFQHEISSFFSFSKDSFGLPGSVSRSEILRLR